MLRILYARHEYGHSITAVLLAWDNLSSQLHGGAGTPSGDGDTDSTISGNPGSADNPAVSPRVPAMGQASDFRPTSDPAGNAPEVKNTAYEFWRRGHRQRLKQSPSRTRGATGAYHEG